MRIGRARHESVKGGYRQTTVELEYDGGGRDVLWFRVPEEIPAPDNGDAWLAIALPLGAYLGEDIRMEMPVDPWLKQNGETLVRLWRHWYPGMTRRVRIEAETEEAGCPKPAVASTFTAGVDSYFTVLRHPECKDWIHVLGLDMPLWKEDAHRRLTERLEAIGAKMGARLHRMATNLRETRWGKMPWESYSSGAALSGSLLQLAGRFGTGLIPSSFDVGVSLGWGSHPLSDPLYSTSRMRILHDGASHSRTEKTEFVADYPIVLETLHVCFVGKDTHGQDEENCSRCGKCYRTMLTLDALGKLKDCKIFDHRVYDVRLAGNMDGVHPNNRLLPEEVRELAAHRGREDVVRQLDISLRKSRLAAKLDRLSRTPLLWRLPHYYRKHAFGGLAHLERLPAGAGMEALAGKEE